MNRMIAIASGHGAGDVGAVGQGSCEAAECIQIVARLDAKLRADTRFEVQHVPDELGLADEIAWVNKRWTTPDAGLALEIHKNSGGGHGSEAFYYSGDAGSQAMAQKVVDSLAAVTGLPNRGVKPDDYPPLVARIGGRLGWLFIVKMPSMLVEAGFQDSDPISDDWDDKFAEGIYQGILAVYGLQKPAPAPEDHGSNPVPLSIAVEVQAPVLNVRSAPRAGAAYPSGQGTTAEGTPLNADSTNPAARGNYVQGQVVTIKEYAHGDLVDASAAGGEKSDLWGRDLRDKHFWLGGTNFAAKLKELQDKQAAAAQAAAAPPVDLDAEFRKKYNVAQLPGGDTTLYALTLAQLFNMDTDKAASSTTWQPGVSIVVKYAAGVGDEVFYMTEYSVKNRKPNGYAAEQWTKDAPVVPPAAPVQVPVVDPAALPAPTVPAPGTIVQPAPGRGGGALDGVLKPGGLGEVNGAYLPADDVAIPHLSLRELIVMLVTAWMNRVNQKNR